MRRLGCVGRPGGIDENESGPYPLGKSADRFVRFRCTPGRELECVLQPLAAEVSEPDRDTGPSGGLGEAAAFIEEQLINADLDVHRRQARQAGVKRAGVRILRAAAFAEEDARQRLDGFLALNQRILALLDGSDSPVYSVSTH